MPENKRCRNCNALTHDCIPEAGKRCCGAWRPRQPEPEKRVFEFGQFSFQTHKDFEKAITDAWAAGKTPIVTVEVLK